jgi:hypothetical protein
MASEIQVIEFTCQQNPPKIKETELQCVNYSGLQDATVLTSTIASKRSKV